MRVGVWLKQWCLGSRAHAQPYSLLLRYRANGCKYMYEALTIAPTPRPHGHCHLHLHLHGSCAQPATHRSRAQLLHSDLYVDLCVDLCVDLD